MLSRAAIPATGAVVSAIAAVALAVARPDESPAATLSGAELFVVKGCATCHTGPDSSATIGDAPSLARVGTWAGERVEGLTAAAYLTQSMTRPAAFISPEWSVASGTLTGMPQLQLSDREVAALAEYLLADRAGEQG
jgi:mono/diheme cytochrome c family protein